MTHWLYPDNYVCRHAHSIFTMAAILISNVLKLLKNKTLNYGTHSIPTDFQTIISLKENLYLVRFRFLASKYLYNIYRGLL